jgi:CBS domain containing-hemolysin-like protein
MIGYIVLLIVLLVFSAFFSGIELAVFSSNKVKLKTMAKKNKQAKQLLKMKKDSKSLLTTILIGNNVVNIGSSAIATFIVVNLVGNIGVAIATGVMTFLILIFGEITPKSYATQNPEKLAIMFVPVLRFFLIVFYPLTFIINFFTRFLRKGGEQTRHVTEEEIKVFISESVKHGGVEKEEENLIKNILQFNDIKVYDVMTPRTEMFCLPSDAKLSDYMKEISLSQFSRIPLYKGTKDNIVGVFHVKDAIKYLYQRKNVLLKTLASKPYFIPEQKVINDLFKKMQIKGVHLAIVVDEFGGTAGLVTLEDLIEEIVGEIVDEFDLDRDFIIRIDKNNIKVHAGTEIKEINSYFQINLPGKKTDNISAFVLKRLKKIPKKGEKLKIGTILITILEANRKKINKVLISKGVNGSSSVSAQAAMNH